ncbi:MAG: DUF1846 domain-containing protein [Lachnospiraceae bacterium]|nr:DUF1846 domain-containing protein [Lachnospiraceae bacterium]
MTIGFDNDKYLKMQSEHIRQRIAQFGDKLYLEFGGKLFDDFHASRVLPGFLPDSKMQMLLHLKDQAEIVIVVSASAIAGGKIRSDLGITYDQDVLRLIDIFVHLGLYVGSVCITQYTGEPAADRFREKLNSLGVRSYILRWIPDYPDNVEHIVSDEGYGKNDYIETSRPLVVVTAPGPGSGKMAACLSQLYHEHKRGFSAGYAKFETFPVWNLPLKHPVNLAYEAATADLNDVNMIDPFHLDAYGTTTINYNRDIESFPVLVAIFRQIYGECPYKSPTDMGVNMAGNCIIDDEVVRKAARQEILRRYYAELCNIKKGSGKKSALKKIETLLSQVEMAPNERSVVTPALVKEETTGHPAAAIELPDGSITTGKTTELLVACASVLLNALKILAGLPDELHLISPEALEPITKLKKGYLATLDARLHIHEVLIALSISSANSEEARLALEQLDKLKNLEMHSTVMLDSSDEDVLRRLHINLTCEPRYEFHRLYQDI